MAKSLFKIFFIIPVIFMASLWLSLFLKMYVMGILKWFNDSRYKFKRYKKFKHYHGFYHDQPWQLFFKNNKISDGIFPAQIYVPTHSHLMTASW